MTLGFSLGDGLASGLGNGLDAGTGVGFNPLDFNVDIGDVKIDPLQRIQNPAGGIDTLLIGAL